MFRFHKVGFSAARDYQFFEPKVWDNTMCKLGKTITRNCRLIPWLTTLLVGLALFLLWGSPQNSHENSSSQALQRKTRKFIENLSIEKYQNNGSDFGNPRYSPLRLGKPLEEINITYDYDFPRLLSVEASLRGIYRPPVLKHIFQEVTKDTKTNREKHLALLKFMHRSGLHNGIIQPMYPDRNMVSDPLVLLELSEMRCGAQARVAVDLFVAGGMKARLAQAGQHILAEVYYDDGWHYFDADIFGNGENVSQESGLIPSFNELSGSKTLLEKLDSLSHYIELMHTGGSRVRQTLFYPSYYYADRKAYTVEPKYYVKTASSHEESDRYFGWHHYKVVPEKHRAWRSAKWTQPTAVRFSSIRLDRASSKKTTEVEIRWQPSKDPDGDLLGYKVFIGTVSRNWSYNVFQGENGLLKYWNDTGGWKPGMYENLFRLPPHDVALLEVKQHKVTVDLESFVTYFVSVMPFDAHGKSVGKKLYLMSEEIRLKL